MHFYPTLPCVHSNVHTALGARVGLVVAPVPSTVRSALGLAPSHSQFCAVPSGPPTLAGRDTWTRTTSDVVMLHDMHVVYAVPLRYQYVDDSTRQWPGLL